MSKKTAKYRVLHLCDEMSKYYQLEEKWLGLWWCVFKSRHWFEIEDILKHLKKGITYL